MARPLARARIKRNKQAAGRSVSGDRATRRAARVPSVARPTLALAQLRPMAVRAEPQRRARAARGLGAARHSPAVPQLQGARERLPKLGEGGGRGGGGGARGAGFSPLAAAWPAG